MLSNQRTVLGSRLIATLFVFQSFWKYLETFGSNLEALADKYLGLIFGGNFESKRLERNIWKHLKAKGSKVSHCFDRSNEQVSERVESVPSKFTLAFYSFLMQQFEKPSEFPERSALSQKLSRKKNNSGPPFSQKQNNSPQPKYSKSNFISHTTHTL